MSTEGRDVDNVNNSSPDQKIQTLESVQIPSCPEERKMIITLKCRRARAGGRYVEIQARVANHQSYPDRLQAVQQEITAELTSGACEMHFLISPSTAVM